MLPTGSELVLIGAFVSFYIYMLARSMERKTK